MSYAYQPLTSTEVMRYGPRVISYDVFTCEGAVDAHRLLSLTHSDICRLARHHGWNSLTEERWRYKILSKDNKGKTKKYTVKVCYEATIAYSEKEKLAADPLAVKSVKGVDGGVMTILKREAKQKIIDYHQPTVAWLDRLRPWVSWTLPWSYGDEYITIM